MTDEQKFALQLQQLALMGFSNHAANLEGKLLLLDCIRKNIQQKLICYIRENCELWVGKFHASYEQCMACGDVFLLWTGLYTNITLYTGVLKHLWHLAFEFHLTTVKYETDKQNWKTFIFV